MGYGINCGTITRASASVKIHGVTLQNQREANFLAWQGDIGGPVLIPTSGSTVQAVGIMSAINGANNDNFYSAVWYVPAVTVCTYMTCS